MPAELLLPKHCLHLIGTWMTTDADWQSRRGQQRGREQGLASVPDGKTDLRGSAAGSGGCRHGAARTACCRESAPGGTAAASPLSRSGSWLAPGTQHEACHLDRAAILSFVVALKTLPECCNASAGEIRLTCAEKPQMLQRACAPCGGMRGRARGGTATCTCGHRPAPARRSPRTCAPAATGPVLGSSPSHCARCMPNSERNHSRADAWQHATGIQCIVHNCRCTTMQGA